MRHEKPLPREGSFKEYADNRPSGASKPRARKSFGGSDNKPDRRESRGNSFKEDRRSNFGPRSNDGPREMFDAVCGKCKKPCKVPFKPTMGKPVSCSDCFVRKDAGDRRSSFGGRSGGFQSRGSTGMTQSRSGPRFARTNSGTKELFDAVCSKCNNKCKVPFKPTTGKPVSCSNCFVKRAPTGNSRPSFGGNKSFGNRKSFGDKKSFGDRRR